MPGRMQGPAGSHSPLSGATTPMLLLFVLLLAVGPTCRGDPLPSLPESFKNSIPDPYKTSIEGSEKCKQPIVSGTCSAWISKWYYDSDKQQCNVFQYTGCEGNDNRFDSQAECEYHCLPGDHTLPPYMTRSEMYNSMNGEGSGADSVTTEEDPDETPAGAYLELPGSDSRAFTFTKANSFVQIDDIPNFQLRFSREIKLSFRTMLPHGILAYHGTKEKPSDLPPYALYVLLERGQLKVVHVIGENTTSVTVGKGLNRDKWHSVRVQVNLEAMTLMAEVDTKREIVTIYGLGDEDAPYNATTELPSVVSIGGLSPEERLHGFKYIIGSFVGCISNVSLLAGENPAYLEPMEELVASKHDHVTEGCQDTCRKMHNLCFQGSRCVNHYSHYTCDCFGTHYEGDRCDMYRATTLTMRGYSYMSYRVYDWKDRVHAAENRFSVMFKTHFDDSTLFYASGESHKHHHLSIAIRNHSIEIELELGDSPIKVVMGKKFAVTRGHWHNVTVIQKGATVKFMLDQEMIEEQVPGDHHHFYLDPEICLGGGPRPHSRQFGSKNNFVGSLKYAYFNDVNLLYELEKGSPRAHYVSLFKPDFKEEDVRIIPITFPFPAAHILWPLESSTKFNFHFYFKSSKAMAVLASGNVTAPQTGYWELRVVNEEVRFEVIPLGSENASQVVAVRYDSSSPWLRVEVNYNEQLLTLDVNYRFERRQEIGELVFGQQVMLAGSSRQNTGLVGCLREIVVDKITLEPRSVVHSDRVFGQVSLDNCQLVDPCSRPDACKHGGKCAVTNDKVTCDCKDTGYTGKNCHFTEFRKTCEELALLGYTKPDVYLIDIDGNGVFPPAHVKCEFKEDETKTIIEHNLPSQVDVRARQFGNFKYEIKYREFTPEMMQELVSHSLYCTQHVKYDCFKAPLELHTATWFKSAESTEVIDRLGETSPGICPCKENNTCTGGANFACHCDSSAGKWLSDEATYTSPNNLGITEMFFMQQPGLDASSQGRMTLGPLECVEANTQKYVVTFTNTQSYIEVPGWRSGDLAFSFRTTVDRAILLHQPPIRANQPGFTVILSNEYELLFKFTLQGGSEREMTIKSDRKMNGGDWQKIWIDYNEHHVRFMINTRAEMVDLKPGETFGPFEGSMFIGGVPDELLGESDRKDGLVGCFRGLVVNGEILNIYAYISVHLAAITKDCKPSCDPNPCQNGALCKEGWSSYVCQCQNPWAHLGDHCERDINEEGLTFRANDAYLSAVTLAKDVELLNKQRKILTENILMNVRTHQKRALLLHAYDHHNNFVKLHIDNDHIVFSFNSEKKIEVLRVKHEGLSRAQPVQIAVIRGEGSTTLHVGDATDSVLAPLRGLTTYTNQPWVNPELETLVPQRPLAPPTGYFAMSLAGFDPINFRHMPDPIPGFIGCVRGFQVGEADYLSLLKKAERHNGDMIEPGCAMKCDERPCQNEGYCTEDFGKKEATCDCTHTSYTGPACAEEKGAHFSGHSYLKMALGEQSIDDSLKVQFAFSAYEVGSVIMHINNKDAYFLAALDDDGKLRIEDRTSEDSNWRTDLAPGFGDGNRHSVLYARKGDTVTLLVDRKLQTLTKGSASEPDYADQNLRSERAVDSTQVYLGGIDADDKTSKFSSFKNYTGCLSNVVIEVGGETSRPLEEYMGFAKNKIEKVVAYNGAGIKSGYCAVFAAVEKSAQSILPTLTNVSMLATDRDWKDTNWIEDPPSRIPYTSPYKKKVLEEDNTNLILIILASIFLIIVIGCIIELIRNNKAYKRRRRQEAEMWMPPKYTESVLTPPVKIVGFKSLDGKMNGNGTELQPLTKNEAINSNHSSPPNGSPPQKKIENTIKNDNSEAELKWEPQGEGAQLLGEAEDEVGDAMIQSLDHLDQEEGDDEVTAEADRSSAEEPQRPGKHQFKFADVDSIVLPSRPPRKSSWRPKLSPEAVPVFLSEQQRTYGNPVSYLGGPLVRNIKRASKESVLSLD